VSLWVLSLSKNEWGGQLIPALQQDGTCILSCDQDLIRGTGLESNEDDRFYLGGDNESKIMIAVTPFYREVFQVHQLCHSTDTVNLFFHSHPLFLLKDIGMLAPPSMGDFFAHALLSNYRNYKQNNQLNTAVVASFEGLYVYFALPHRFDLFKKRVDALWEQLPKKTKTEIHEYSFGELPLRLIDVVKMETFDQLREGFDLFMQEYADLVSSKNEISTVGAPIVQDSKWSCKGCEPAAMDFAFSDFVKSHKCRSFVRSNSYLQHLHKNGFHYEFFPAPITQDIYFLALMRLQYNAAAPPFDTEPLLAPPPVPISP
jgi:hypothetical protein